jgi:glycosyltransferase involved in cell wall biosynthesis
MNEALPGPPLRIAVLGDFEGPHTRRWIEPFLRRGHEIHAISFYQPRNLSDPVFGMPNLTMHVLRSAAPRPGTRGEESGALGTAVASGRSLRERVPPSFMRVVHAWRYQRAGLKRVVEEISPDVFHAHYVVEHGFYGSFVGFHPYVVSAWGSDLLVESQKAAGRRIARRALGAADLVTANDVSLARRAIELGVPQERVAVVHLGIEPFFLQAGEQSVNLRPDVPLAPTIVSTRAHERLYHVDAIIRAFARIKARVPDARLVVAGHGSQTSDLRSLVRNLGVDSSVEFRGQLEPAVLAVVLADAHVYVSVPSSDSLALSNLEAMAAGAYPIVAGLPSIDGWVTDGDNGLCVTPGDVSTLAEAMLAALSDAPRRQRAVAVNRAKVELEGLREPNMLLMERHYYRLAGHPLVEGGEAI